MRKSRGGEQWIGFSLTALKSIYGFEFQGDNLILARINMFLSYLDYYEWKFNELPHKELMIKVADIISWNLWQMDGLKMVVPFSCHNEQQSIQTSLFEEVAPKEEKCIGCKTKDMTKHNGIYSCVMDWKNDKIIRFIDVMK